MKIYVLLRNKLIGISSSDDISNIELRKKYPTHGKPAERSVTTFVKKIQTQLYELPSDALEQVNHLDTDTWLNLLGYLISFIEDHDINLMTDQMVEQDIIKSGITDIRAILHKVPEGVLGNVDSKRLDGYYYRFGFNSIEDCYILAIHVPENDKLHRTDINFGVFASLENWILDIKDIETTTVGSTHIRIRDDYEPVVSVSRKEGYVIIKLGVKESVGDENILTCLWSGYLLHKYVSPYLKDIPSTECNFNVFTSLNDDAKGVSDHFFFHCVSGIYKVHTQPRSGIYNPVIVLANKLRDVFDYSRPTQDSPIDYDKVKEYILSNSKMVIKLKEYVEQVNKDRIQIHKNVDFCINHIYGVLSKFPQSTIKNGVKLKLYTDNRVEVPLNKVKTKLKEYLYWVTPMDFLENLTDDYILSGDYLVDVFKLMVDKELPKRLKDALDPNDDLSKKADIKDLSRELDNIQELLSSKWYVYTRTYFLLV